MAQAGGPSASEPATAPGERITLRTHTIHRDDRTGPALGLLTGRIRVGSSFDSLAYYGGDGEVVLVPEVDGHPELRIEIKGGAWTFDPLSLSAPVPDRLVVQDMKLSGRRVIPVGGSYRERVGGLIPATDIPLTGTRLPRITGHDSVPLREVVPAGSGALPILASSAVLDAVWAQQVELHVLDRQTRAPLTDVRMAFMRNAPGARDLNQPPDQALRGAPYCVSRVSPLRFEDPGRDGLAWVAAEGYAWGRWRRSSLIQAETEILLLDPGGRLGVEVQGHLPEGGCIRLRSPVDGRVLAQRDHQGHEVRVLFGHIAPGPYRVSLEMPASGRNPTHVLGQIDVVVAAGRTTSTVVQVHEPRHSDGGHILVDLPDALISNSPPLVLRLFPLADGRVPRAYMELDLLGRSHESSLPNRKAYRLGPLQLPAGPWSARITEIGWQQGFEILPGRPSDVVLSVAEPVLAFFYFVDAATGEAVEPFEVRWGAIAGVATLQEDRWWTWNRAAAQEDLRLRVPAGRMGLRVRARGYATWSEVIEIDSRTSAHMIELEPRAELRIKLKAGEDLLTFDDRVLDLFYVTDDRAREIEVLERSLEISLLDVPIVEAVLTLNASGPCVVHLLSEQGSMTFAAEAAVLRRGLVTQVALKTSN